MSQGLPRPDAVRDWLLAEIDVRDACVHFATEGMISTSDLWWLYEEHRIMAPADAWLLVAMWEVKLPQATVDDTLANPGWWRW